jgi:hypothetical protein
MGMQVVAGAVLQCSFGVAPSALSVLPANRTNAGGPPAANIMDYAPMVNIAPFGLCSSLANPMVASATAAALGVLTPMPCIPNTVAPWSPGAPTVMIANMPALDDSSICMCAWAGVIKITMPGQVTVQIP